MITNGERAAPDHASHGVAAVAVALMGAGLAPAVGAAQDRTGAAASGRLSGVLPSWPPGGSPGLTPARLAER